MTGETKKKLKPKWNGILDVKCNKNHWYEMDILSVCMALTSSIWMKCWIRKDWIINIDSGILFPVWKLKEKIPNLFADLKLKKKISGSLKSDFLLSIRFNHLFLIFNCIFIFDFFFFFLALNLLLIGFPFEFLYYGSIICILYILIYINL